MDGQMPGEKAVGDFVRVRAQTDALASPLSAEDQCAQSMPDASPTKWHRAHTTWFFETFILKPAGVEGLSEDAYSVLYNSYYNGIGEQYDRASRGLLTRPSHDEVTAYRARVDAAMLAQLDSGLSDELAKRLEVGLHHEQQHQELLLTDIKHLLSCNPLQPAYAETGSRVPGADTTPPLRWAEHDGQVVRIGCDSGVYHFDNEAPSHEVLLRPFSIAQRLVTNGEYRAFMADGGYDRAELWLSDGWQAVQSNGWRAPLYWLGAGDDWTEFTLYGRCLVEDSLPWSTSATTRPTPTRAGPVRGYRPSRNGRPRQTSRSPHRCVAGHRLFIRSRRASTAPRGNGRARVTPHTPAIERPPVRSANTTASSCAASTC